MKGRYHGEPFRDYKARKWLITFETDEPPVEYDELKDMELSIQIKRYREKRSLNANSYFHVLVGKIAEVLGTSHAEIHNRMITRYGTIDEEMPNVILRDDIPYEKLEALHLQPTQGTRVLDDGKLYRVYKVFKGSHLYDTKEMSTLIDGTVSEARELGIETATPDELRRMKEQWKVS